MGSGSARGRLAPRAALVLLVAATVVASLLLAGAGPGPPPRPVAADAAVGATEGAGTVARARRPNIVFVLADDMAAMHLAHMPRTRKLVFRRGARFTTHVTNVSLCCPARASLLTGKYAHNTGVMGNEYPHGFHGFHTGDERRRTYAVALRREGYRTSMLGKYLNQYPFVETARRHGVRRTFVPNGWSDWAVPIRGQYHGVDYRLNLDGRIVHRKGRGNYLGDVMAERAVDQIEANRDGRGLLVVLSSYGPHVPEPASPVERNDRALQRRVRQLHVPRTPGFDERDVSDKPAFIRELERLSPRAKRRLDARFRRQVVSVSSLDRHVGMVVRALRRTGQLRRTFIVFTSDNGIHLGSHRMPMGKNTAYDTDTVLPLAIRGPGIEPGTRVREVTGNIDLAPTFADMAGTTLPHRYDGESLLPLARGRDRSQQWRRYFYLQQGYVTSYRNRDGHGLGEPGTAAQARFERRVPLFEGVFSRRYRFIARRGGGQELYDVRQDPHQLRNILARPAEQRTTREQEALEAHRAALLELRRCEGRDCRVR